MDKKAVLLLSLLLMQMSVLADLVSGYGDQPTLPPSTPRQSPKYQSSQGLGSAFFGLVKEGEQVNVGELLSSSQSSNPTNLPPLMRPRHPNPAGPTTTTSTGTANLGLQTTTPVSLALRFDGLNQTQSGQGYPPDVTLATGPTRIMEMSNWAVEFFTKQGNSTGILTFGQFFSNSHFLFDPKVIFDTSSGRWFASVGDRLILPGGTLSIFSITIAVSATTDPGGTWRLYHLSSNNRFLDQPTIGVSDDKFVISTNDYADIVSNSPFLGAQIWVLNKNDMLAGVSARFASYGPLSNLESVHPVESLSSTETIYLVSSGGGSGDLPNRDFHFFSIAGVPPATPTVRTIPLSISPILTAAPPALQPGGIQLDSGTIGAGAGDSRMQSASWYNGKLWLTFTDGCIPTGDNATRSCFRLVQIDTTVSPMIVRQDFDVGAAGKYYFYPALSIDNRGNLAVVFGYSSATNSTCCYPSVAVTGQAVGDPTDTFKPPLTLKVGSSTDISGRYGDYFGARVDPSDQSLVWVAGEYHGSGTGTCRGGNCWSTFIASVRAGVSSYEMSTQPPYQTGLPGSAVTSTITLTSVKDFSGQVSLSASIFPTGPTIALGSPALTLKASGSNSTFLLVSTTVSTFPGTYIITLTGSTGSLVVLATVTLNLAGFVLAPNPSGSSLSPGSSAVYSLTLGSVNNFTGTVSLLAKASPSGIGFSLSQSSVSIPPDGSNSTQLTTTTTTSTPTGVYTVNVTATSQAETQSIFIPLAVTPVSLTIKNTTKFAGVSVVTKGTVSIDSPSKALTVSGTATVTATNATTGKSLDVRTYTITRVPIVSISSGNYQATFLLGILTSPSLASEVTVSFTGLSSGVSVQASRNPDINLDGIVDAGDVSLVTASLNCGIGNPCYNPNADLNADGIINSLDVAIATRYLSTTDFIPNFNLSASPTFLALLPNVSASSNLSLLSLNGFAGTTSLSTAATAFNFTISTAILSSTLSLATTTLSAGGTGSSVLTVSSSSYGDFIINVTATSGSIIHSVFVAVHVVDFAISANVLGLTFTGGGGAYVTITLTPLNFWFAQSVQLASTVSPVLANGPLIAPNSTTATVLPSVPTIEQFWVSTNGGPAINYTLTFAGTIGPRTLATTVPLIENDFSLSLSPQSVAIPISGSAAVTIQLTALNQFADGLFAGVFSGLPSCATASFGPNQYIAGAVFGGPLTASITMTLNIGPSCPASTYNVVVYASAIYSGDSHSASLSLKVTDFNLSAPSQITDVEGAPANATVTVTSINGFTGTIALSKSVSPSTGLACSLTPTSVTNSGTSTLSCIGVPGTYKVTLTGTSGTLSHSAILTFQVVPPVAFTISATPPSLNFTFNKGVPEFESGNVTITVSSVNGTSGPVSLSISPVYDSILNGPSASFRDSGTSTDSITLSANQSISLTISVSLCRATPNGTFTFSVTGTSGSTSHVTTFTVKVSGTSPGYTCPT